MLLPKLSPILTSISKVASDKIVPPDQVLAWQRDRTGAMVDMELAKKYGWKIGDRITLDSPYFPVKPELTIRAIYKIDPPARTLYFSTKYLGGVGELV